MPPPMSSESTFYPSAVSVPRCCSMPCPAHREHYTPVQRPAAGRWFTCAGRAEPAARPVCADRTGSRSVSAGLAPVPTAVHRPTPMSPTFSRAQRLAQPSPIPRVMSFAERYCRIKNVQPTCGLQISTLSVCLFIRTPSINIRRNLVNFGKWTLLH